MWRSARRGAGAWLGEQGLLVDSAGDRAGWESRVHWWTVLEIELAVVIDATDLHLM